MSKCLDPAVAAALSNAEDAYAEAILARPTAAIAEAISAFLRSMWDAGSESYGEAHYMDLADEVASHR